MSVVNVHERPVRCVESQFLSDGNGKETPDKQTADQTIQRGRIASMGSTFNQRSSDSVKRSRGENQTNTMPKDSLDPKTSRETVW